MLKALNLWLPAYLRRRRQWSAARETHLLICVCDHFEPFHGASREEALRRVRRWGSEFPNLAGSCRDSGGQPLRHTFFYPIEQYDEEVISHIAELCRNTRCETELHLHHKEDTAENLALTLQQGKADLSRHGLLSTDATGAIRFGFIHGNWALDNSHPAGKFCGVRNELRVLREAGCYADFTLPSAPDLSQTATINSLYYAIPSDRPKSHNHGRAARVGAPQTDDEFLLIQGPLGLNWRWRKWGCLPRIENADLTPRNPPTLLRLRLWMELNIHVEGRPEWLFAKLHTHGGTPRNMEMLLGDGMRDFHGRLPDFAAAHPGFHYHYVTARELVNIVHAGEAGMAGNPGDYRDFQYTSRRETTAS